MYLNQGFSSGSYADMLSGTHLLPHGYTESVGGQNEVKFIAAISDTMTMQSIDGHSNPGTGDPSCTSFTGDSHVVSRVQVGAVDTDQNIQSQGLSLSLGTLMPSTVSVPPFQYQYPNPGFSSLMNETGLHKELRNDECMTSVSPGGFQNSIKKEALYNMHASVHSDPCLNGSPGFANSVLNSQYLKAAQELFDELVNVRKALKQPGLEKHKSFRDNGLDGTKDSDGKSTNRSMQISSDPNGSVTNSSCELSPAERQNLLDKKTKLLSMLDEVDKRYRQYCHQMQMVVSSFDMVAGCGAAEPYTALALRTISRHFRCLRDAISGQIQVTQRSLGEQEGIPRLRYVDQQLRQQKALQQLGVMRQAWRPQRGLPESSVSILRAWLFEHFLHPYPKDSEKIMLARQTGLTRNQVANWFINARVRLWKPMVEEMYKEEFGDSEISCNLLSETTAKAPREDGQVSDNKAEESQDNLIAVDSVHQGHASTTEMDESAIRVGIQTSVHGEGFIDSSGMTKFHHENQRSNMNNNNNNTLFSSGAIPNVMDSSAAYDLSELGNFPVSGHVSLALELRNCESDGFAIAGDGVHKRRNNQTLAPSSSSPENDLLDYHFTDPGKQQHRFGNPHLLHEFVV